MSPPSLRAQIIRIGWICTSLYLCALFLLGSLIPQFAAVLPRETATGPTIPRARSRATTYMWGDLSQLLHRAPAPAPQTAPPAPADTGASPAASGTLDEPDERPELIFESRPAWLWNIPAYTPLWRAQRTPPAPNRSAITRTQPPLDAPPRA